MSTLVTALQFTKVGRVCVPVSDTDRSIDFYVNVLGFEKIVDVPMCGVMRWVEVALPGCETSIALAPPPEGQEITGTQTGICLDTADIDADHAALKAAGIDVDEQVTRFGGPVPPMFWLRDPGRPLADHRPANELGSHQNAKGGGCRRGVLLLAQP